MSIEIYPRTAVSDSSSGVKLQFCIGECNRWFEPLVPGQVLCATCISEISEDDGKKLNLDISSINFITYQLPGSTSSSIYHHRTHDLSNLEPQIGSTGPPQVNRDPIAAISGVAPAGNESIPALLAANDSTPASNTITASNTDTNEEIIEEAAIEEYEIGEAAIEEAVTDVEGVNDEVQVDNQLGSSQSNDHSGETGNKFVTLIICIIDWYSCF